MATQHIPSIEEVLALFKKSGNVPTGKDGFTEAFKALYPMLTDEQRAQLLQSLLAYVDSLLQKPSAKAA